MDFSLVFSKIKSLVIALLVFLFPLFFLPTTQEFFITNKLYLLAFGGLLLIAISTVEFAVTKKLTWKKSLFDNSLVLFLIAIALSTIITSTNKVQAVLNPNFGLFMFFALVLFYYYSARHRAKYFLTAFYASASVVAALTVLFFLNPFKNVALPESISFLKSATFNTFGSQIDLGVFLGFAVSMVIAQLIVMFRTRSNQEQNTDSVAKRVFYMVVLGLTSIAFLLTLYSLYGFMQSGALVIPPLRLSWFAGVEVLKNPLTALFGVGIDNFPVMFGFIKDLAYNQSVLWQTNYFSVARSGLLHIMTESGILGFVSFVLLTAIAIKHIDFKKGRRLNPLLLPGAFLLLVLALLPPSLTVFFLLMLFFVLFTPEEVQTKGHVFDSSSVLPLFLSVLVAGVVLLGALSYLTVRSYAAEYMFKTSLDAIARNNARDLYTGQQKAITLNPFIERYHINFAQTNLLLANNVAQRALQQSAIDTKKTTGTPQQPTISEQDRQIIGQAIQAAIAEAKSAVALNQNKASNWENLAVIYRNVLNVAEGADVWTISSYQRAIIADPQNPVYRLNLGGVYYSLNNFSEAAKLFEQSISLKNDWPNAHYNLAWTAYQLGDYQKAASEMQNVLTLLNPKTDKSDIVRAQADLEEFKKKLPKEEPQTQGGQQDAPQQLVLPSAAPTIDPKISLPQTASPEAN